MKLTKKQNKDVNETSSKNDVFVSKDQSWEKFVVMPCNSRESVWATNEVEARRLAQEFANQSGGRVICRF